MLFENGKVAESIEPFRRAAALAPKNTDEIHTEYAQALLESGDAKALPVAISELKIADKAEPRNPSVHRFLATAYGRQGKEAVAKVELAEEAVLSDRPKAGRRMAAEAMRLLPAGSPDWLRAQDLLAASLSRQKDGEDRESPGIHFSVGPGADSLAGPSRLGDRP
jgi:predicted Zn-dependent protease